MKGQRRKLGTTAALVVKLLLDFPPHLLDTDINQNDWRLTMEKQQIEELRQKYIQTPPEGMTAKLVKNMNDSDLLDMHYLLTEDDDLDDGEYSGGESIACPVAGNQEIVSINLLWLRYHGTEKSSMLLRTAEAARH
jgi:hypothetical protein